MTHLTTSAKHGMAKYLNLLVSVGENRNNSGYVHSIVHKALSDPYVFTGFDELKNKVEESYRATTTAAASAVTTSSSGSSSETSKVVLNTLELFSYGTFQDYMISTKSDDSLTENHHTDTTTIYMKLTDGQITKLKALSIISALDEYCKSCSRMSFTKQTNQRDDTTISQSNHSNRRRRCMNVHSASHNPTKSVTAGPCCRIVPYSYLQKVIFPSATSSSSDALSDNTTNQKTQLRELEDLLIYCMDFNLLPYGSKLDQKHTCLEIHLLPSITSSTVHSTHHIFSRDVPLGILPNLIDEMRAFLKRGLDAKRELEQCVDTMRNHASTEEKEWSHFSHTVNINSNLVSTDIKSSSSMVYCLEEDGNHEHESDVKDKSTGWSDDTLGSLRQGKRSKGGPEH
jgi:hypothetical protein